MQKLNNANHFLNSLSGSAYVKALDGTYLDCNDFYVQASGLKHYDNLVGFKDYDFWPDYATEIMHNDKKIISTGSPLILLEQCKPVGGNANLNLSHKEPLYNKSNKIIGVIGISFDLAKTAKHQIAVNHNLSQRHLDCLRLLARGKKTKDIAYALKLSPRTVDHYIEAVKLRLNCDSRSQLIEAAWDLGLAL